MFDGLNNNRAHWNELAEVYNAKMKAIEDEKKRLEEEEAKKGKNIFVRSLICWLDRRVHLSFFFFVYLAGGGGGGSEGGKSKTCTIC